MILRSLSSRFWFIVTVAFLLRLATLDQQSYWTDEILSITISSQDWTEMHESILKIDNNKPPLYYLFMHEWLKGGQSEMWARMPSAIFGALTCGIVFLIGYRLMGMGAGWIAALYLVVSPFHLTYSQETRMYSMFGLAAGATLLYLILYFQEKKWGYLICFGLLSVLVNYTFSYGFFFLGLAGLLVLVEWKKMGTFRSLALLGTLIISFAIFIPWLTGMIHDANTPELAQYNKGSPWPMVAYTFYSFGYGFDLGPTLNDLQVMRAGYFITHPAQTVLTVAGLAVLTGVVGCGLWALRKDRFLLTVCLGGLLVFLLGPAMVSSIKPSVTYNPRYALLGLIPFSLIMAVGIMALWEKGLLSRSIVLLYGVFLSLALYHFYCSPDYRREDLRGASKFVEQLNPQPKIIVVCADFLDIVVSHYYHGPADILRFNVPDGTTFDADVSKLNNRLGGADRFLVVYARTDLGDPRHILIPWLESHYRLIEHKKWYGADTYLFLNPSATPVPSAR